MIKIFNAEKELKLSYTKELDLKIEHVLSNGDKTLSFLIPIDSKLTTVLEEEGYIETKDHCFVIKGINSNFKNCNVIAKLNVEELEGKFFKKFEAVEATAEATINSILVDTGWSVGYSNVKKKRTTRRESKNAFELIQVVKKIFNCDIVFDTKNKQILIYSNLGSYKGEYIRENMNLTNITAQSDSYDFYTRLEAEGKDGLTFSDINNGKNYVEDYSYSSKVKTFYWKDERYTIKENLLEDAREKLKELSKPRKAYTCDVVNLSENISLGDTIEIVSKRLNIKEKQRVIKYIEYPETPEYNYVELSNNLVNLEDLNNRFEEASKTIDDVTNSDGTVDVDKVSGLQVKVNEFTSDKVNTTELNAVIIQVGELNATKANITDLNATNAEILNLKANKADIAELNALSATVGSLQANVANINTVISGNLTSENIQTGGITGDRLNMATIFVNDANILNINAKKITAGEIDISKVSIRSEDGGISIVGATQKFSDKTGRVRIQIGRDNQNNFDFYIVDENGNILFNTRGITGNAIAQGLITEDKLGNGAVSGDKINWPSFENSFNSESNTTILKASKIEIDGTGQKVNIAFNSLKSTVEDTKTTVNSHTTQINVNAGKINTLISDTTIVKDGQSVKLKDVYTKLEQSVDSLKTTVNRHTTDITAVNKELTTAKGEIVKINGKVTSVESATSSLTQKVNSITQRVEATESTTVELQGQINTANNNISNINSNVAAIDGKVITTSNKVSELTTNLSSITQKVSAVETTTATLEKIAEKMLINNFSRSGTKDRWTSNIGTITSSDVVGYYANVSTNGNVQVISNKFEVDSTKTYKISLMVQNPSENGTGSWYFGVHAYDKSGNNLGVYIGTSSSLSTNPYFHSENKAKKNTSWRTFESYVYAHNTVVDNNTPKGNCSNYFKFHPKTKYLAIRFLNYRTTPDYGNGATGSIYFAHPTISEVDSNIANTNTNIANLTTEVTTTKNKVASIETNLNGIISKVTSVENSVVNINGNIANLQQRMSTAEHKITSDSIVSTVRSSTAYTNDLNAKANQSALNTTNSNLSGLTTRVNSVEQKITPSSITTTISSAINGGTSSISTTQFVMDKNGFTVKNGAITVRNKSGQVVLSGNSNGDLTFNGYLVGKDQQVKLIGDTMKIDGRNGALRFQYDSKNYLYLHPTEGIRYYTTTIYNLGITAPAFHVASDGHFSIYTGGARLKLLKSGNQIQSRTANDSGYASVAASDFYPQSSSKFKSNIKDTDDLDFMNIVNKSMIRQYNFKTDVEERVVRRSRRSLDSNESVKPDIKLGVVVEELPEEVKKYLVPNNSEGISLYNMTSILWGAFQEQQKKIDILESKIKILESA